MNSRQAAKRLTALGFKINPPGAGCQRYGTTTPELFTTDLHVLSVPFRDVFFARAKGGWYVTSHIKFTARRRRARLYNTFGAELKNIFGHGRTLELAIKDFENNYNLKVYNIQPHA
jgi:hypothetical protein